MSNLFRKHICVTIYISFFCCMYVIFCNEKYTFMAVAQGIYIWVGMIILLQDFNKVKNGVGNIVC